MLKGSSGFCALVVSAALLLACGDEPARRTELRGNSTGSEIQPTLISDDSPAQVWRVTSTHFGRPFAIRTLGDSLAIVLDRADPFMHLIDVKQGEYLYPLVASGDDNAEPLNIYRVATSPTVENEFVGYDLIGSTLTTFRIGNARKPLSVLQTTRISAIETVDSPIWHHDGSVSVEPVRETSLRARVLPGGDLTLHSGIAFASFRQDWVPAGVWREAMEGQTCTSPDRARLARTFQFMGQVMVLDSLGQEISGNNSARFFAPQFEVRSPTGEVVFAPNGMDVRLAYRACGATKDFIFTLFSGRRARMSERNTEITAAQIHIYDWRARLVAGFRLQRDAVSMDVTPDGRLIVALEGGRDATVAGYSVPRKFRTR